MKNNLATQVDTLKSNNLPAIVPAAADGAFAPLNVDMSVSTEPDIGASAGEGENRPAGEGSGSISGNDESASTRIACIAFDPANDAIPLFLQRSPITIAANNIAVTATEPRDHLTADVSVSTESDVGTSADESAAATPIVPWRDVLLIHPAAEMLPSMTDEALCELAADIKVNGIREEIVLFCDQDGETKLLDGRCRLDAGILAELPIITDGKINFDVVPHRIVQANTDPIALVLSLNVHRRHLTAEQKRNLIAQLIKAKPESSNNAIARQAKADDKTVAKVRGELERRSEIPNVSTRVDTRGRSQPARRQHNKTATSDKSARLSKTDTHANSNGASSPFINNEDRVAAVVRHLSTPADERADVARGYLDALEDDAISSFFANATGADIHARIPADRRFEVVCGFWTNFLSAFPTIGEPA